MTMSGTLEPVPWWSFTKTVLAIAALRLVEHGLLSLHQTIAGERFTLAHLLRHEAGLPDYGGVSRYHQDVNAGKPPWPVSRLLEALDAKRSRYEPGKGWAYSNLGYLKVRELIELITGMPLQDALAHLVFIPANLSTARVALLPADLLGVQMGDIDNYHPAWVYHGLVVGTTADAARLLQAFRQGLLLGPGTFASMLERRALPEHRNETFLDPAYALGLMLNFDAPLEHPIGHRGAGPGSSFAAYSQGGRTCALWDTTPSNSDCVALRVFNYLAFEC